MVSRSLNRFKKQVMTLALSLTLILGANFSHAFGPVDITLVTDPDWIAALDSTSSELPEIAGSMGSIEGTTSSTETTLGEWETKQVEYNTWKKSMKKYKWTLLGLTTIATGYFGALMYEIVKTVQQGNTGHNMGKHNTSKQSPKSHKGVYGSKSTFANMMEAYKQPNKVCSGQGDNKECYNATNAGTMSNHLKFKSDKHEKAAKQYANYAAGGAIGTPKPNKNWNKNPNPSTIRYHAYYKNQAAMGSHSTNQMAQAIGGRQVTNSEGKTVSKYSIYDKSRRQQPQTKNSPSSIPAIFQVLFGQLLNVMKIPQTAHSIVKGVEDASQGVSTVVSQISSMVHHAFGRQIWEDAMNEAADNTYKKIPW